MPCSGIPLVSSLRCGWPRQCLLRTYRFCNFLLQPRRLQQNLCRFIEVLCDWVQAKLVVIAQEQQAAEIREIRGDVVKVL